jgi:hypothetical protein
MFVRAMELIIILAAIIYLSLGLYLEGRLSLPRGSIEHIGIIWIWFFALIVPVVSIVIPLYAFVQVKKIYDTY